MYDIMSLVSIYMLALIGLASIIIIGIAIFFAYKYDITFSIKSGKGTKNVNAKGK